MDFCQLIWYDNPPGCGQSHPNNLHPPSTHLSDTFQTTATLLTLALWRALVEEIWNRFDGVWKVSGRCLEGVCVTLNSTRRVIMPNQLIKSNEGTLGIVLIGWFLFSQWPWIGHWVPYFGVSTGCLEDVWEVSWVVWMTLDILWGGVGVGAGGGYNVN